MARGKRGKDAIGPAKHGVQRRRAVHVFTEGRVTEPEYIEAVKTLVKVPAAIRIANQSASDSDRSPVDLVRDAIALKGDTRRSDKKAGLKKAQETQVWCIFDHDGRDRNMLVSQLAKAANNGVLVAFSNPCFELWRLLHVKAANGTFGNDCDRAADRLPREFHQAPGGIKHVVLEQVKGEYETARKAAEAMNAQHPAGMPLPDCDPYTDVHEFVRDGMGVTAY